jgi:hypothetical protein
MSLVDEFRSAVDEAGAARADRVEVLPTLLAQACVAVLPVAGAGVSMTQELRVPLGYSDEVAAAAERLQTTVGEGPCLTAASWGEPVVADVAVMASRWPMFTTKLVEQTPYRWVISLPLPAPDWPGQRWGAVDLYSIRPSPQLPAVDVLASEIAEPVAETLFRSPPLVPHRATWLPVWARGDATRRLDVWIAVGMVSGYGGASSTDALALLRGYALTHDTTLDAVAEDMITRKLTTRTVLDSTENP